LLKDVRIFQNLALNDSSHRAKEIGTKIVKVKKFPGSWGFAPTWPRAYLGVSPPWMMDEIREKTFEILTLYECSIELARSKLGFDPSPQGREFPRERGMSPPRALVPRPRTLNFPHSPSPCQSSRGDRGKFYIIYFGFFQFLLRFWPEFSSEIPKLSPAALRKDDFL